MITAMAETKQVIISDQLGGQVLRVIFRTKKPRRHLWGRWSTRGNLREELEASIQTGNSWAGWILVLGDREKASVWKLNERTGQWPKLRPESKARPKHVRPDTYVEGAGFYSKVLESHQNILHSSWQNEDWYLLPTHKAPTSRPNPIQQVAWHFVPPPPPSHPSLSPEVPFTTS